MNRSHSLPLLCLALASTAFAAGFSYKESASSSVTMEKNSEDQEISTIRNTTFEVVRDYEMESLIPVLLKKEIETIENFGMDGSAGRIALTARISQKKAYDQVIYTIKEEAHEAMAGGDGLLLTRQFGCCDSATTYRAFHLMTGKKLFTYDDHTGVEQAGVTHPFVVEVPNTPLKRYLGILTDSATRDFEPGELDGRRKVATLTYASLEGAMAAFDVYYQIPEQWGAHTNARLVDLSGKGEIRANRLSLWASDGQKDPRQAFGQFAIELTIMAEEEVKVILPFKADQLDLGSATLPDSVRIVPVKLK